MARAKGGSLVSILVETGKIGSTLETDTLEPLVYGNLVSRRRLSGGSWVPRYCHFDAVGSLDGETDAAGSGYFNRFVYRAFGEIASEANLSVPVNWRYVGRLGYYYDRLTPTLPVYVRARWLATALGRWLIVDLIYVSAVAAYVYASNSPARWTDPSGMLPRQCGRYVYDPIIDCTGKATGRRRRRRVYADRPSDCTSTFQSSFQSACDCIGKAIQWLKSNPPLPTIQTSCSDIFLGPKRDSVRKLLELAAAKVCGKSGNFNVVCHTCCDPSQTDANSAPGIRQKPAEPPDMLVECGGWFSRTNTFHACPGFFALSPEYQTDRVLHEITHCGGSLDNPSDSWIDASTLARCLLTYCHFNPPWPETPIPLPPSLRGPNAI